MDFDLLAADVEAQVARLDLDRPIVVGHSMGGMVAQTLLRRGPHAWRAAVLSCTSPAFGDPTGEFQKKFVADRLGPLDAGRTMADLAPAMVAAVSGPAPDPAGRQLAIETSAVEMETLSREKMLQEIKSPLLSEIVPAAIRPITGTATGRSPSSPTSPGCTSCGR